MRASAETRRFETWRTRHDRLLALYERTPETDEATCDTLLAQACRLRALILDTPAAELPAIRLKASLLLRYMEQERSDDIEAMRDLGVS